VPLRDGDGIAIGVDEQVPLEMGVGDLVVVAEFGDPIYPGLKRIGSVSGGGDRPAHVVINGENHHALEALQFTHAGKVDCVYIDPPYNTGARDWKYNNDYVDDADIYRHSKWLAFMERRLALAKKLLNPEESVLIVTIDEKEYLRLGLLLEQVFPGAAQQMVSIVINPSGTSSGGLSRVDEYAFFCFLGGARPVRSSTDLLDDRPAGDKKAGDRNVRWEWLLRGGGSWYRASRPNLCYPVVLDEAGLRIVDVGDPFDGDDDEASRPLDTNGHPLAWPVRSDGRLGIWRVEASRLMELVADGFAYVSQANLNRRTWTLRYLLSGTIEAIRKGDLRVVGRGDLGQVLVEPVRGPSAVPKTVWKAQRHVAGGGGGTQMLQTLLGGRNLFPYPKSLYAVEDCLHVAVGDKASAVVLDFFAGSGTTAHAVARLNRRDGGQRQSILVTNNEVSAEEAKSLAERGLRDGDPEWEQHGIFEKVARPRIEAAITGFMPSGEPVKGEYKFVDEFPMAEGFVENVEFFELTYQDAAAVELDLAFEAVAPLLWLRAGGQASTIERHAESGFAWAERYGVLWDTDRWQAFVATTPATATTAFIVTDSATAFAAVVSELPAGIEPVRLYENYLTTFAINQVESE